MGHQEEHRRTRGRQQRPPLPSLETRERRKRDAETRETEMATTTICLAAMLLVSGPLAQKPPCPRKFLVAQAEGLYQMPATAQQNATATVTNATDVAEVANDTIALRSEGCYDITVHKCDCDAELTEDSCTKMGRIWTVHCECHLEELAGTQSRRVLLQFEDTPMMNDTVPMMNDTMTNMTMDANATEPAGDEVEDEPVEEEEEPVSVDIEFPDSPEGAPDVANTLGRRVLLQFEDAPMMNDTVPMMNDTMTNMTMDANATEPAGDEVEDE